MSICTVKRPQAPQFKFDDLFNEHFSWIMFFSKAFFSVKTGEVDGSELLLKTVQ